MRGLTRKSPHRADYRRAMTSTYKRARKLALQIIHRLRVGDKAATKRAAARSLDLIIFSAEGASRTAKGIGSISTERIEHESPAEGRISAFSGPPGRRKCANTSA